MPMKNADQSKRKKKSSVKGLDAYNRAFLIGVPVAVMIIISILLHMVSTSRQRHSITRTIDKWKPIYHLNEQQAVTIRRLELEFHGSGSAFSFPPSRSGEEKREHHKRISEEILPEFREKFLSDMERGRYRH